MKTIKGHKIFTLDEAKDEIFGIASEERTAYERYAASERQKEEERLHRVAIPESLYILLRQRAVTKGMSVTGYVQTTLSSAVS